MKKILSIMLLFHLMVISGNVALANQLTLSNQQEKEYKQGFETGITLAKVNFQKGLPMNITKDNTKSLFWNIGFEHGYKSHYDHEAKMHQVQQIAYDQGYSLKTLSIPFEYKSFPYENWYRGNYQKGKTDREDKENKTHYQLGKKDGYQLSDKPSNTVDNRFISAYEEGFETGKNERKEEVELEGYQYAFQVSEYQAPLEYDKAELLRWHKEGYNSNTFAAEVKKLAFENGKTNKKLFLPENMTLEENILQIYIERFEEGQEFRKKERQKLYLTGFLIVSPIVLGLFLLRRKMDNLDTN